MNLLVPHFSLTRGTSYCLHLPRGKYFAVQSDEVVEELQKRAEAHRFSLANCQPAMSRRGILELFRPQRTCEWLARAAGVSMVEARNALREFQVPEVSKFLASNPATVRCMLGVAAGALKRPDILVYSTEGLDPLGCAAIHAYAFSKRNCTCLVHLSPFVIHGDGSPAPRLCDKRAVCIPVT